MIEHTLNLRLTRITLILAAALYGNPTWADTSYSLQIPAQRLDLALQSLAQQSGTQILFVTKAVNNYQSDALNQKITVEQALQQLLKGKNLQIQKIADHKFSIVAAQAQAHDMGTDNDINQNIAQLPVITVKAEDEKSYTIKSSTAATKLALTLKETPQSITVFTRQQIEDQNLTSAAAILAQTPGITSIKQGQEGSGNSQYFSRGFVINNYQRDGIPTSGASFGGSSSGVGNGVGLENTGIYERVEIIRGATGLTSGSGNPSSSINYVRKRPTENLSGSVRVSAGSWDNYRSEVDIGGGLNNDSSIRGRAVAVYEQGGNQQERYHRQNALFYGALDVDLSEKTTLTSAITLQQIKLDDSELGGFPFVTQDTPPQPQTIYGRKDNRTTDWSYFDSEKLNIFLGLEHQFNDDWQGIANYSFSKVSQEQEFGGAGSAIVMDSTYTTWDGYTLQPGEMLVVMGRNETSPEVHALDVYTSGKFNAFGQQHSVSFGVNGYSTKSDNPYYREVKVIVPVTGWNGHMTKPASFQKSGKRYIVDEVQLGTFAAAKLQLLDSLKLIVGSRLSYWERKTEGSEQKESGILTPYFGLIFDINKNFSIYGSYTSIFNPQSSKDVNNNFLDPVEGNNVEVGIKADFYDERLNLAAAYFDMQQDNYAIQDGDKLIAGTTQQAYKAVDGVTVKGYEFSVSGEVLPNWNINAGYTHTDAKDRDGKALNTQIPEDTFKLFTTYQWNKLTMGVGYNGKVSSILHGQMILLLWLIHVKRRTGWLI
ncbi:TonB-dependent siderophore receptor [Acinetobacter larvae]|uniref:TonB-dependent siderophore receptor n=1 Tax=Acinetobacter larvae TaxID=1789224 RepID=UPI000AC816E7|nr:TonB-dependent receptor [Acinetobacter larvae]